MLTQNNLLKRYTSTDLLKLTEIVGDNHKIYSNEELWKTLVQRDFDIANKLHDTWLKPYQELASQIIVYVVALDDQMSYEELWKKFNISQGEDLFMNIINYNSNIALIEGNNYMNTISTFISPYLTDSIESFIIKEDKYNQFKTLKITYKINYCVLDLLNMIKESINYYVTNNDYYLDERGFTYVM